MASAAGLGCLAPCPPPSPFCDFIFSAARPVSKGGGGSLVFKGCTVNTWRLEMVGQGLGQEIWGPGPQGWREGQILDKCENPGAGWEVNNGREQTLDPTSAPSLGNIGGRAQAEALPSIGGYMGVRGCWANMAKLWGPHIGGPGSGFTPRELYLYLCL